MITRIGKSIPLLIALAITTGVITFVSWIATTGPIQSVAAQYSNTIIVPPFAMNLSGGVQISNPLTNIGQSVHSYSVTNGTSGGHACNGTQYFGATIQGSYDNITYFIMPQQTLGAGPNSGGVFTTRLYQASGAFPYIRISVGGDGSCTYTIAYSGVVSGAPVSPLFLGTSGTVTTPSTGLLNAWNSININAGDQVFISHGSGITDISVYQLSVCNVTAGQTVTFKANGVTILKIPGMAAGQCYAPPVSTFPVISTIGNGTGGLNMTVSLSNATEVDFGYSYRFE